MKNPETIEEAIARLEQVAKFYFPNLGWKQEPSYKIDGEIGDDPSTSDSDRRMEINEWLFITPFITEETYPCIGGTRKRKAIHYEFEKTELVRGVHYYPDGSGEPDFVDVVPIGTDKPITSAVQAICFAINLLLSNELDQIGEMMADEEMATDVTEEEIYQEEKG